MRQLGLIEDGAILIVDGVIENVGPTRRIENLAGARSAEEINAAGRVVMPGLIDSHTRIIAAPPRVGDSRPAIGADHPMNRNITQVNAEHIRRSTAASLDHQARRFLAASIRHGATTLEGKSGFGQDESGEIKMLKVLAQLASYGANVVPTFLAPHMPPSNFNGSTDDFVRWICESLIPKVKQRNLAQFVDAFCDSSGFNVSQAGAILDTARRVGLAAKLQAEYTSRTGAVRMAVEMGAVSVDGLNYIDTADIQTLAGSRTIGVVMPGPMHQGYASRFAPVRQMIDAGVAVGLASGFHPQFSATLNMMTVIGIACTHMGMTPEEAITAATVNGAYSVGKGSMAGSLVYGREADLIMLTISDYREIPYNFGVNLVAMTMRKGQVMYREGAVEWNPE